MILMINVKLVKPRDGKVKGTNNQLLYSEFETTGKELLYFIVIIYSGVNHRL
jgi:hypothetical protein